MSETATITSKLDVDLDKRFRLMIMLVFGSERGAVRKALEESIQCWIEKKEAEGYQVSMKTPE